MDQTTGEVGKEHERTQAALGAWAADAGDEGELRTVEAHLEACGTCADEADRLRRAAAWLGGGQPAHRPPACARRSWRPHSPAGRRRRPPTRPGCTRHRCARSTRCSPG
jgi:hypothetical protein